jgi:uncharacterized protein YbaP (TraB family)
MLRRQVLAGAVWALIWAGGAAAFPTYEECQIKRPFALTEFFTDAELRELQSAARQVAHGVGRFWRITSRDGAVSHLWGTAHSNQIPYLDLPKPLRQTIAEAKVVALEYDFVARSRADLAAAQDTQRYYTQSAVSDFIRFEYRLLVDSRVQGFIAQRLASGNLSGWLDYMRPVAIAETVMSSPCSDFADGVYPIQDARIQLLGEEAGARIVGLEPQQSFVEVLNTPERRDLALAIIETYGPLLDPEPPEGAASVAFALYDQGLIGLMMVLEKSYLAEFYGPEKADRLLGLTDGYLLIERNQTFVQAAAPLLNEGGALIAVGAFHLPGENGLVALFRAAGYTVERIPVGGEIAAGDPQSED